MTPYSERSVLMTVVLSSEEEKTIEYFQRILQERFFVIPNANVLIGIDHIMDLRQCHNIST